jgi:hypothetical protein
VQTESENFNFIFKNQAEDDSYEGLYEVLPPVLLFLSHVILGLYNRMKSMDPGARTAVEVRTILGLYTLGDDTRWLDEAKRILDPLPTLLACPHCKERLALTRHNVARLLMRESFRCTRCRVVTPFPFSYLFNS